MLAMHRDGVIALAPPKGRRHRLRPIVFGADTEPPLSPVPTTLAGSRPPGNVAVTRGTVRVRFVDRAATVTTEVSDPPPPPGNKPVIVVRRRPDGAPDLEVTGGKALVRLEGWEGIEHGQT